MAFICDIEVYDRKAGVGFRFVSDPTSDEMFGLSCTMIKGGRRTKVHVSQLDVQGKYVRALLMLGRDFDVPLVGIFVPLFAGEYPVIGRWQTAFEAAGLEEELAGLSQRAGMKLLDRASQSHIYITAPAIGSYTKPEELLDSRQIELVRRHVTQR